MRLDSFLYSKEKNDKNNFSPTPPPHPNEFSRLTLLLDDSLPDEAQIIYLQYWVLVSNGRNLDSSTNHDPPNL